MFNTSKKYYEDLVTSKVPFHFITNTKKYYMVTVEGRPTAFNNLPMIFEKSAYFPVRASAEELHGVVKRLDRINLPSYISVNEKDVEGHFMCYVTEKKRKKK